MRRWLTLTLGLLLWFVSLSGSVFEDIVKWFSGAAKTVEELAERAYNAVREVWHVAGRVFELVGEGWDWMVNGIEWIGDNIVNFAGTVYNTITHILGTVIPKAISWVLKESIDWAEKAVGKLTTWVEKRATSIEKWAVGEFNKLIHTVTTDAKRFITDITKAFDWIDKIGQTIANYIEHPVKLAELLAAHIVMPIILFILKSSASIIGDLIRGASEYEKDFAAVIEDVLAKII